MLRRTFLQILPGAVTGDLLPSVRGLEALIRSTAKNVDDTPTPALVQTIEGAARFTVITAGCIRMEYAPHFGFVDAATLFACNRAQTYADAVISRSPGVLTIDTGIMRLEYRPDGNSFSKNNLKVKFTSKQSSFEWIPGVPNNENLKGPVATLDGVSAPIALSDGLLSKDGWYLLDDTGQPVFEDGWIRQRIGGGPDTPGMPSGVNPDKDWYLFAYGRDYKAALRSLTAISGPVPMPRREVHGAWYCRWYPYTSDQFREIVAGYKEHDFPLDILVMDMEWHKKNATTGFGHAHQLGWTGYTWNRELIPDPAGLLQELREDGIHVTLNDHPADGIRQTEECYPHFMDLMEVPKGSNLAFDAGSKRYMEAFFEASHRPIEDQGVDFWWVDWQQDYILPWVHGVPGLRHLPWLNYLYYIRSQRDNRRGQGFSRWGGWGDHKHPIQFSGDAHSSWEMLAFEIYFTLVSGNAGCFFWAHDLGGFYGASGTPKDAELYTRWFQFGALSSSFRIHSNTKIDRRPWIWGEQFEDAMRQAAHLRSRIFPYIYTSIRQCYDKSIPLLRPMYLEYPSDEIAYKQKTQYFLGDSLLVAPITMGGKEAAQFEASRQIWFPAGTWYGFCKSECITGGVVRTVSAKLGEIPLYVRAGTILTMQPYTPRMTSEPLTTLILRCYPGKDGEAFLYEDDGDSMDYTVGGFARTRIRQWRDGMTLYVTIKPVEGNYKGQLAARSYRIEIPYSFKAEQAKVNGRLIEVLFDEHAKLNMIDIPATALNVELNCAIKVAMVEADS